MRRHGEPWGDRLGLVWEQEAAGSNPAIPTSLSECAIDHLSRGRQSASVASRRPAWLGVLRTLAPTYRGWPDLIQRVEPWFVLFCSICRGRPLLHE
jgi:hypothetical protein